MKDDSNRVKSNAAKQQFKMAATSNTSPEISS